MRSFRYRNPRFHSAADLTFHVGDITMQGVCMDLSREGLLAIFEQCKHEVGTLGWIMLRYSKREFTLGVTVTHQEDKQVGLAFLRRTREERTAADQFAAFLGLEEKESLLRRPK